MTAINVEKISKRYRLGSHKQERADTFRGMLAGSVRNGLRRLTHPQAHPSIEEFWALRDVSFNVQEGQRLGIIGRNGAGKSTLLKLLSRITEPTAGCITLKGRVGSLLEVGTGFHGDLSGRENIYLNGAILGMKHADIRRRFDAIVAFAEVDKFLDTPVKRYSSGMYVRLAFAVAAHLEPDVLIVDEVLAVGDAAFQQKCLGKMDEIGRSGRTILFVSHNMGAITQMCDRAIILKQGRLAFDGKPAEATRFYAEERASDDSIDPRQFDGPLAGAVRFEQIGINDIFGGAPMLSPAEGIALTAKGQIAGQTPPLRFSFALYANGMRVATVHDSGLPQPRPAGIFEARANIPAFYLRPGEYSIRLGAHTGDHLSWGADWTFGRSDAAFFTVTEEWSERNDFANVGLVNIPQHGKG